MGLELSRRGQNQVTRAAYARHPKEGLSGGRLGRLQYAEPRGPSELAVLPLFRFAEQVDHPEPDVVRHVRSVFDELVHSQRLFSPHPRIPVRTNSWLTCPPEGWVGG